MDLGRKKEIYATFGVAEYWFVDLESDRIEIYRLEGDEYG
jgi:Uma2 family endonuclease